MRKLSPNTHRVDAGVGVVHMKDQPQLVLLRYRHSFTAKPHILCALINIKSASL